MKYFYLATFALLCMLTTQLSAQTTYLWSTGATTQTINVNSTVTTTYYVTITHNGVDYLDSLVVTVNPAPSITGQNTVCSGGSTQLSGSGTPAALNPWISSNTNIATISETGLLSGVSVGSATITYTNSAGCEQTLEITVTQGATGVDVITSCGPITWIDGNTYSTSNNTATHLLVGAAQNGCDSLVTLNLTVTPTPDMPTLACYETATFNSTTCQWEVSGTQPTEPTGLACWQTTTFNSSTCSWDIFGTQPQMPTGFACYQTAVFNNNICDWEVVGSQPAQPTLACYETAAFNSTTCAWDVFGTQPVAPTLACYETADFNNITCSWDVFGTQPVQPTLACYETASFNNNTCSWDVFGTQPVAPTLACYETADFNNITCSWDVFGTQPVQPTLACYETASFNSNTCSWDVFGTQPVQPTLACYETASFNNNTCSWDVFGTQPAAPTLACYETADFNNITCSWDVFGTQPVQPTLACYETASFNNNTCSWDVFGTQPVQPTLACYETADFNNITCSWDVFGTPPGIGIDVITSCIPITWIDGNTYSTSNNTAQFNIVGGAANGCDSLVTLNLTISNSVTGIDQIASCTPITWIDGNTYTESNYTATFNIVGGSTAGCDSLVTLNFTITPCTQLRSDFCNVSNMAVNTNVRADIVSGAVGYRYRITGPNNGAAGWNGNTFVLNRPNHIFKFNMAPGVIWTQTYTVEVAVTMDGINFGAYGSPCTVTLEDIPTTQLEDLFCGSPSVLESTRVKANTVTSAAGYRFRITGNNDGGAGWNVNVFVLNRPNREFRFTMLPGVILGETYAVEVAVLSQNGVDYGNYGPVCNVTIDPPQISMEATTCGATNVNLNDKNWAVSVAGAVAYRFRIVGPNNGAPGWNGNEFILDRPNREFRFIEVPGAIWGQTYTIQAASSLDGINYSSFGLGCPVTLENIPISALEAASCGVTNVGINTKVRAAAVPGAAGYRFRIVGNNTGAPGWNGNEFILDRPNRDLRFVLVPGHIARQTYTIDVAVLSQDGVTYSAYGSTCTATLSNVLMQGINPDDENIDMSFFEVSASHNPFITDFGLKVLTEQIYEPITIAIYDMSGKLIERQTVYPLDMDVVRFGANLASDMYMIEARQGGNQLVVRQVKR